MRPEIRPVRTRATRGDLGVIVSMLEGYRAHMFNRSNDQEM